MYTWCLTSTETIRLIRDREKGVWRWEEEKYFCDYTVTTRMTFALRWAVMRAILMFHNCEGQSRKTVSTDHKVTGLTQMEMIRDWLLVEGFNFFKVGKWKTDSQKF